MNPAINAFPITDRGRKFADAIESLCVETPAQRWLREAVAQLRASETPETNREQIK